MKVGIQNKEGRLILHPLAHWPRRPKPFTIAEIQKILDGFRSNNYYSGYHDFVFFLLGVGCRPGEAALAVCSG